MTKENIIRLWRSGKTVAQVAKEYMQEYNSRANRLREPKITENEAFSIVEPIIFDFETK